MDDDAAPRCPAITALEQRKPYKEKEAYTCDATLLSGIVDKDDKFWEGAYGIKHVVETNKVCGMVSDAEAKEKEIDALNAAMESVGGFWFAAREESRFQDVAVLEAELIPSVEPKT